jgi:glycerol-3-phosphate dehydrogenase
VERLFDDALETPSRRKVRLVKGSHIVVPRLYAGGHAYILQHQDGRVVFVLPYEDKFSLIGTTDVPFEGDPAAVAISEEETAYLIQAVGQYFRTELGPGDVVQSYAGIRPLYDDAADDPSAVTRDYVIELDQAGSAAPPLLSVYGGKITTYRRLAEQALEKLAPFFPEMGSPWTEDAPLPGGDVTGGDMEALVADLAASYSGLDPAYLKALARRHGTLAQVVLGDARADDDLGVDFGAGLRACEVDYLCANEWALTADDILWRRTKCGLHMNAPACARLADCLGREDTSLAS